VAITRRVFLKRSVAGAAAASLWAPTLHAQGANDDIRVGVVGTGGQGSRHVAWALGARGVRVVAVCDADKTRMARAAARVKGHQKADCRQYNDVRKLLDDREIDAVMTATPNHWHSLIGIWACQAGKDIYVEKPISHNIFEGRKLAEAAAKYKRIVYHGTQSRSDSCIPRLQEFLKSGKIGKVTCIHGMCYKRRDTIGKVKAPRKVPDGVDYNLWCGPAPTAPLMRRSLHYDWHWVWPTGNGDIGNQGVHEMDQIRWMAGDPLPPARVLSIGGRLGYDDDGETPNTQIVFYDYRPVPLIFEVRGLGQKSGMKGMDHYRGTRIGIAVECEGGWFAGKHGGRVYDSKGKGITHIRGGGAGSHVHRFFKVLSSRKSEDIPSDALSGHLSSTLVHMGNISYRLGRKTPDGEIREKIKGNAPALEAYGRMAEHLGRNGMDVKAPTVTLGAWLEFDPKTERFTNNDEANALLGRDYRAPYVVPDKV
jgi:predicted dehydrogenase